MIGRITQHHRDPWCITVHRQRTSSSRRVRTGFILLGALATGTYYPGLRVFFSRGRGCFTEPPLPFRPCHPTKECVGLDSRPRIPPRVLCALCRARINIYGKQMPLSNRIAAACLDRTVSFYEMLTGEFVCRIAGLRSAPTCIDCIQVGRRFWYHDPIYHVTEGCR